MCFLGHEGQSMEAHELLRSCDGEEPLGDPPAIAR